MIGSQRKGKVKLGRDSCHPMRHFSSHYPKLKFATYFFVPVVVTSFFKHLWLGEQLDKKKKRLTSIQDIVAVGAAAYRTYRTPGQRRSDSGCASDY